MIGMYCEKHPWMKWPHDACPGPGRQHKEFSAADIEQMAGAMSGTSEFIIEHVNLRTASAMLLAFADRCAPCQWTWNDDSDSYSTSCGDSDWQIDGGPYEFCPSCGRKVAAR